MYIYGVAWLLYTGGVGIDTSIRPLFLPWTTEPARSCLVNWKPEPWDEARGIVPWFPRIVAITAPQDGSQTNRIFFRIPTEA